MDTVKTKTKTKWTIDPSHSEVSFKVKHLMISSVKGVFRQFDGDIYTNGDSFSDSEIDIRIKAASIDTGDEKRDAHLRSADFFDADQYPEIRFKATSFENVDDDGNFDLHGDFTIKNITKPIKMRVEYGGIMKDPWGNYKAGLTLEGKINRKDWDLNWNAALEAGGWLVGDEVKLICDIQLFKVTEKNE